MARPTYTFAVPQGKAFTSHMSSTSGCYSLSFWRKASGEYLRRVLTDGEARMEPSAEHPIPNAVTPLGLPALLFG